MEITKKYAGAVVWMEDQDGQFLLIEAHPSCPAKKSVNTYLFIILFLLLFCARIDFTGAV